MRMNSNRHERKGATNSQVLNPAAALLLLRNSAVNNFRKEFVIFELQRLNVDL